MKDLAFFCVLFAVAAVGFDMSFEGCAPREFKCKDGTCMKYNKFCDQKVDCDDHSDEEDCLGSNPSRAQPCDIKTCKLPHCFCSFNGRQIPGNLTKKRTPQMIMLTFDDAFNTLIGDELLEILDPKLLNPNGCTIKGTLFVSNDYTDYTTVHRVHRMGHEIGVHSISHSNSETYWRRLSVEGWTNEMIGQKNLISKLANITKSDIKGMRAPLLAHGANNMVEMMRKRDGFLYDSSLSAGYFYDAYWPYTFDYQLNHKCAGNPDICPTRSFPGVWEIPINQIDPDNGASTKFDPETGKFVLSFPDHVHPGCGMIDSCHAANANAENFLELLTQAFYRNYNNNRAPLGLFMHVSSFKGHTYLKKPMRDFIRHVLEHDDVYFVRMSDVIEWMKNPTPTGEELNTFEPWLKRCNVPNFLDYKRDTSDKCITRICKYSSLDGQVRVCNRCPRKRPSLTSWRDLY